MAHRRVRGGRQEEGARYMLALSPPHCNSCFLYLFIYLFVVVGAGQVHRNQGGRRGMEANQARGTGGSSTAQVRSPPMRHCALFRFVCVCACVVSLSVCVCVDRGHMYLHMNNAPSSVQGADGAHEAAGRGRHRRNRPAPPGMGRRQGNPQFICLYLHFIYIYSLQNIK